MKLSKVLGHLLFVKTMIVFVYVKCQIKLEYLQKKCFILSFKKTTDAYLNPIYTVNL